MSNKNMDSDPRWSSKAPSELVSWPPQGEDGAIDLRYYDISTAPLPEASRSSHENRNPQHVNRFLVVSLSHQKRGVL